MVKNPHYIDPIGFRASFARTIVSAKKFLHPRLHDWLVQSTRPLWSESDAGISVQYGEITLYVDLKEGAEQEIFLGLYDPCLAALVANICTSGDIIIDAGANVGIISIIAANSVGPEGRVLAIEPNPVLANRLRILREANNVPQLVHVPVALGPESGKATLHLSSSHPYSSLDVNSLPNYPVLDTVEVDVETLESIIGSHLAGMCPKLLKLDVQGYENKIILGSESLLRANPPKYILIEVIEKDWTETVRFLKDCGYVLAAISETGHPIPCDAERLAVSENALFYLPCKWRPKETLY